MPPMMFHAPARTTNIATVVATLNQSLSVRRGAPQDCTTSIEVSGMRSTTITSRAPVARRPRRTIEALSDTGRHPTQPAHDSPRADDDHQHHQAERDGIGEARPNMRVALRQDLDEAEDKATDDRRADPSESAQDDDDERRQCVLAAGAGGDRLDH